MGFIKIHRNIREWGWYDDANTLVLWIHLLIDANYEERTWHGQTVGIGSMITSVAKLSEETGLTVKQVRICLGRLVNEGKIVTQGANKWTKITVCDYESYMLEGEDAGQTNGEQKANKRQTEDKQRATPKEEYNTSDTIVSSYSIQEVKKEKKEGDTAVSPKKERVDYNLVKKTWNDSMTRKVPKIQGLSEARKEKVKVRVDEMGGWDEAQAILRDCFKKVNDSDFCNGANDHQWVATFDWFFSNDKNWMKVSEGNYDNKRQASRFEQSMGVAQRAKNLIGLIYGTGNTGTTDGFADTPDEQ